MVPKPLAYYDFRVPQEGSTSRESVSMALHILYNHFVTLFQRSHGNGVPDLTVILDPPPQRQMGHLVSFALANGRLFNRPEAG